MTSIYQFFDADDELLYVGITDYLPTRLGQHDREKPWWFEVHRISVEHVEDRDHALERERTLIQSLRPRHNVAHSLGHVAWSDVRDKYPQASAILERARNLKPSSCGIDNFFACTHGLLGDLPDEVRVLVQFRLGALLPDCEMPCACDGPGEDSDD